MHNIYLHGIEIYVVNQSIKSIKKQLFSNTAKLAAFYLQKTFKSKSFFSIQKVQAKHPY